MLTEHVKLVEAHRVEKLFDLLFFSMSHSKGSSQTGHNMSLEERQSSLPGHKKSLKACRLSDWSHNQAKQRTTSRLRDVNRASRDAKSRSRGADGATRKAKNRSKSVNRESLGARNSLRGVDPAYKVAKIARRRASSQPKRKMLRRWETPSSVSYQFLHGFINFERTR